MHVVNQNVFCTQYKCIISKICLCACDICDGNGQKDIIFD